MSTNPDFTPLETGASSSDIPDLYSHQQGFRIINPFSDQSSYLISDVSPLSLMNVLEQLQEISELLNHSIAPDIISFFYTNLSIIPTIKTAAQQCKRFFTHFFEYIRSDAKTNLDNANIPIVPRQVKYNIEIWEDSDFDDTPKLALIISLPKMQEYSIFTLWEKLDQIIYEKIDHKLLVISVREF